MVYSTVEPEEILITPTEQRLRWGVTQETFEDEMVENGTYTMYVYHEIVFRNKSREFLEQNKEEIIANPESYDWYMLDGKYREVAK